MLHPTFTPERLDAIEADVAAGRFADVTIRQGYGGHFDVTWTGDEALPLNVSNEMRAHPAVEAQGLAFVRDLDERTTLYARP